MSADALDLERASLPHGFYGAIILQKREAGKTDEYIVCEDALYVDRARLKHWIRKGMVVNGGSQPRFFWRVFGAPYVGKQARATIFHDGGYIAKAHSKEVVDEMMREVMQLDGVPQAQRNPMYWAVRYAKAARAAWDSESAGDWAGVELQRGAYRQGADPHDAMGRYI